MFASCSSRGSENCCSTQSSMPRAGRVDVNLALGPGDTIQIQVSDDGAGFGPSATLYDRNQLQAGLGLFSIQERLALLGGHLGVVSAPGKGSRFTLTLPRTGLTRLATDCTETAP